MTVIKLIYGHVEVKESLSDMTIAFETPSISLSPIIEVIPYKPE